MKWSRLILASVILAAASCASPTAPRIPKPDTERPPPPDQPGVIALQTVEQGAMRVRLG